MSQRSITRRNALMLAAVSAVGTLAVTAREALAEEMQQLTSAEALDFLYIDNAEMYAGETQSVVVCLKDYTGVESATLTVSNAAASDEIAAPMSAANGASLLFSFVPGYEGTYEVTRLDFVAGGVAYSLDFTDCDASYRSFATTYGVSTMSLETETSDGEPTLQVYSDDGADGLSESGSIEGGAASALALSAAPKARSAKSGPLVIALDPGHVGAGAGASNNWGLHEEVATWKIAQACGGALSIYQNVKVVYTVKQGETLGSNELKDRVENAVRAGADVLVSLHLNKGGGMAKGAEVYVPYDGSYNNSTHSVGEALAQRIIAELEKVGLFGRGVKIRRISNDSSYDYPDGSDGDYYGIIRHAREHNLPAIIVEHAFMDNWNDYSNFLSSDSKLASLGRADAQGIANYFGLAMAEGTMLRLYNPNTGEHLYTQSLNEYYTLGSYGWVQEGRAWMAPTSATSTPVYRLYNPNSGDHHYTLSQNEYDTLGRIGWVKEGLAWYSDDAKTTPIYRLFNPNVSVGTHHYTLSENEYNTLGRLGWVKEGPAWYGTAID